MSFSPLGSLSLSNTGASSHTVPQAHAPSGYGYGHTIASGDHCVPPPPLPAAAAAGGASVYGHPGTYSRITSRSSATTPTSSMANTSSGASTVVVSAPPSPSSSTVSSMNISPRMKSSSITSVSSPKSSVCNLVDGAPATVVAGVSIPIVATPSSSALSPSRRALPQLSTSNISSPRSGRIHTPKSLIPTVVLPDHIAALNGRWDGECSIHGSGANGMTIESEKTNVWLGCHLAFSPLDGSCTFEHPHNDAALCYATYRIRGHGHSIGSVDGSSRKLIPFQLNGLLDGTSGAFELTVTSHEGEYQSALTSHGTVDFANRSMMADSKGRVGTLRLSFSGNQNTMTSTLRPHLSPKAVAKHLGLLSSAECGSGRPRSGAVLAKVITPAIAPCTPLQQLTPGTTSGPDPLSLLTSKDGAVRVWQGQLVRHGTEHTAILSECVLAFNVSNDIGTIIGTGMASWEGYRVSFTLEGSFDHKHRVTVVWAEVAVKLMTEPPQCEKYTVCIDVAARRIEGHNPFGRLKLEPYTTAGVHQVIPPSSYNMAKMNEQQAINQQAAINASHASGNSGSGNIATTMVPTMMSQNQNMPPYLAPSNLLAPVTGDGNDGSGSGGMDAYGTNGGMMYGPQMTPQGITYTLMPTAMAMQAHAVTAQMLYGVNNGGGYGPYGGGGGVDAMTPSPGENVTPAAGGVGDAAFMAGHDGSEGMNTTSDTSTSSSNSNTSTPVDGRSRSNSIGTNTSSSSSPPSSGPASPLITAVTSGTVTIDPSLPMDDSAAGGGSAAGASTAGMVRPRRYSVTTSSSTTPRNRSGSDASTNSMHAPLQQFEIGDRVYMYTLPSNIVQSVLLRGPITAQALKDSPYPYHSPSQLHYNPGVLVRSDKRGTARRPSQSRGSGQGGAVKIPDTQRRTSGSAGTSPTSSSPLTNDASQVNPNVVSPSLSSSSPSQAQAQPQQQRVVGMSANPNAAGGKKLHNKWPTIKGVRANPTIPPPSVSVPVVAANANNAPGGPRM